MGSLPHILSGLAPGMAPYSEVDIGLGMDLGLAVGSFLGNEKHIPLELLLGPSLGRGPGVGGCIPPQPVPGTALGSSEDTMGEHMAACTADH